MAANVDFVKGIHTVNVIQQELEELRACMSGSPRDSEGAVNEIHSVQEALENKRKLDEYVAEMKSREVQPVLKSAVDILQEGANCIGDRASERDTESERSMARTVKAFNAMFNKDLTETEGWQFMELLKMSRSVGGKFREDDFVDGAAYAALAGECAATAGRTD